MEDEKKVGRPKKYRDQNERYKITYEKRKQKVEQYKEDADKYKQLYSELSTRYVLLKKDYAILKEFIEEHQQQIKEILDREAIEQNNLQIDLKTLKI